MDAVGRSSYRRKDASDTSTHENLIIYTPRLLRAQTTVYRKQMSHKIIIRPKFLKKSACDILDVQNFE